MKFLPILKEIKKLKVAELREVARRLDMIANRPSSTIKDLDEAVNCCTYHFDGKNYDDEICLCNCYCKNCEFIPRDDIGIRMQEIANSIENDDTIPNLLKENTKEIDGKL